AIDRKPTVKEATITLPNKTEQRTIVDTHRHVNRESLISPIVRLNLLFLQIEVNPAVLFRELRSLLRFNLVFVPVLIVGLGLTFWIVRDQLRRDADELVLVNVHLMLETARAFRDDLGTEPSAFDAIGLREFLLRRVSCFRTPQEK